MLLSESELRAALEPLLDRLLTERLRYFQLQLEPRLQAMIEQALRPAGDARLQQSIGAVMRAATPRDCFTAVFEAVAGELGEPRALLVVHGGEIAVWRQEQMSLPAHFPAPSRDLVLRNGSTAEICVRGRVVGLMHWPGGRLHPERQARLELLLAAAGLALLAIGLPRSAATVRPAAPPMPATPVKVTPADEGRAQRFARLLVEDLGLYLRRERAAEFEAAASSGDWRQRFRLEIERGRRAFAERFQDAEVYEKMVPLMMETKA